MPKKKVSHQISVRGDTYDRLRQAANERGTSVSQLVEAMVADVRPTRAEDPEDADLGDRR
jgi:hypothetical protein